MHQSTKAILHCYRHGGILEALATNNEEWMLGAVLLLSSLVLSILYHFSQHVTVFYLKGSFKSGENDLQHIGGKALSMLLWQFIMVENEQFFYFVHSTPK